MRVGGRTGTESRTSKHHSARESGAKDTIITGSGLEGDLFRTLVPHSVRSHNLLLPLLKTARIIAEIQPPCVGMLTLKEDGDMSIDSRCQVVNLEDLREADDISFEKTRLTLSFCSVSGKVVLVYTV